MTVQAQQSSSDNGDDNDYNEPTQSKQNQQQEITIQRLNVPFEEWQATLSQKYKTLYDTVQKKLPHLWPSLEFDLSIKNILHIKDCTLPFGGVVLGKPSSLKTVGIQMFRKSRHTFYTDSFTARSFVSHSSGLSEELLQQIDLLPKIRNKCFLTPELAPTFSAKDDDLIQFIGILTRILDGHGYENDSGAHGHRGYNERMMFTWIGAAVEIPFKVHKLMTTLGPRLYFLRVPSSAKKSDDNYYQHLQELKLCFKKYCKRNHATLGKFEREILRLRQMSTKTQQQQIIEWSRAKVMELLSKGENNRSEIARILQVDKSVVCRDISYLRQQAKTNIKKYIDERLPEEYEKCLVGLTAITKEAWNTAQSTEDKREKIHALSLAKECYSMELDLLTNATVVDDAIRFVSQKCKDNKKLKSPANNYEELKEPDYDEDQNQLEEEQ